ncbi:protein eyes shut [Plodia interpunctella]|uniref:protein eyes shut n=1 Tax=Plodia interpunctella TaxID=58824 RepID=UPI0023688167|nr:protein eyes shut [Plodia interpunctella]
MLLEQSGTALRITWWVLVAARVVYGGVSCLSNPCMHGICIDDINSTYSCYCVDGYTGVQCQTNWDECWSSPCLNGGSCIDGIASYNCTCPDGFIGDNCETNFNECESNPCLNNGTCIDMTNGYICSCVPGFSGEHCEVDIAVCNTTEEVRCYNGGKCIEGPGFKFYCECLPGWAGRNCEDQIDECQSNPCQNGGICIDIHADYMCACTFGFTGKSCEVQIEFCDDNSCSNNALCVVEDGARVCYCVPDYHGERCELQYDECLLGPRCKNGGTCIDGVDNFTCSCPPMLTGALCECLILEDGSYDCEYISPTPLTSSTEPTFSLSSFQEELSSTEKNIAYTPMFNNTSSRSVPTTEESEFTTSISSAMISEVTASELPTELVSLQSTSTNKPELLETTEPTAVTIIDTTLIPVTVTPEIQTAVTIDLENSRTDETTMCEENCETTILTTLLPSVDTATSTETNVVDITTAIIKETSEVPIVITTDKADKEKTEVTTMSVIEVVVTTETSSLSSEMATEITSTPKGDITTEKMFTDTPTEHPEIEHTTSIEYTTTEVIEPTTSFETSTLYTTQQYECTDSICNDHGNCVNTPHGTRCHCHFNYAGKFCDEKITITSAAFGGNSFITHKLRNNTSINIEFNAKTLITDGQIMHVDLAKGVYMQLCMVSGLLKFKFSCGYQTMLLSELKTFVNKGYPMKIETRLDLYLKEQHCNATLRLNDTVAMSGGQVANISVLDHDTTLYLGNSPDVRDTDNKPFVGCIKDLIVNGENRSVFGDAVEAGEVSECSSLACLSAPCLNGGSCDDSGDGYTCSCSNGWTGRHCSNSICENNPCQSGGSCEPHPGSGFLCLCPYGKHGIFCEYNVEITRPSLAPISTSISSYLIYPLSPSALNSDRLDLRLRFQTADMEQIALLAFVGQAGRHDSRSQHLALTFVKGYIMLTWNMGSGPRRVFTSRALSARRGGHTVRVWRRGRSAGFSVDNRYNASGNAPAVQPRMTLLPYVYVGGHPSPGFSELPHDLPLHSGWRGCVWDVSGAVSGRPAAARGAGQCGVAQCTARSCNAPQGVCIHSPATYGCICNEGWFGATCASRQSVCGSSSPCRGRCVLTADGEHCDCPYGKTGKYCDQDLIPTDVLFTGTRSFVQLHPRAISSVSLAFEADVKPRKERGLIAFVQTPHFYASLSLQGGLLEYRWTDRLSGLTSLVRSGVVLSMSAWHSVKAGRYGSRLYVWVDGAISTEGMRAHAYPHTSSNASVLIGGAKDLSVIPFDAMSGAAESFAGCIRNFHINNILVTLEPQHIQEAANLEDCDGTPCGSETCGGSACSVEEGRARCACAGPGGGAAGGGGGGGGAGTGGGGGGRCRRETACPSRRCALPRGFCRKGKCVCATGYDGPYCENRINITIPQFDGHSFLSPSRVVTTLQHAAEQRVSTMQPRAGYVALNFTTAHPNALLFWWIMDTDYFGIGLEGGYLKLAWSFPHNSSREPLLDHSSSRLLPHSGFLSNGEWHTVVAKITQANITVMLDEVVVYVEEPGVGNVDYDDVDLYIGGVTEHESAVARTIFPHNFKGCIDQITTTEDSYLTNYTEIYSENIKSCQLFFFPLT